MSWTMPDAALFKATYAVFSDVSGDVVEAALPLVEASLTQALPSQVIYTEAANLLLAHTLTLRGHGSGSEADLARSGALNMQSLSDGAVSFTQKSTAPGASSMESTSFGQQYLSFMRGHIVPFAMIGTQE